MEIQWEKLLGITKRRQAHCHKPYLYRRIRVAVESNIWREIDVAPPSAIDAITFHGVYTAQTARQCGCSECAWLCVCVCV